MKRSVIDDKMLEYLIEHSIEKTQTEWSAYLHINRNTFSRYKKKFNLQCKKTLPYKHTPETKTELSKKRKAWLSANPDKHPWRLSGKFKSQPCELVKSYLMKSGIDFVEEYQPENISERFFSIDIAIPDKQIALEINGNQHYNLDGSLKEYYQKRHNHLESKGWHVYEIHYSMCYHLEKWADFIINLKNSPTIQSFDYFNYQPKVLKAKKLSHIVPESLSTRFSSCNCGKFKCAKAKLCKECHLETKKSKRKPLKEDLEVLLKQYPMTRIAEQFRVSDKTIKKWAQSYELKTLFNRPRGMASPEEVESSPVGVESQCSIR